MFNNKPFFMKLIQLTYEGTSDKVWVNFQNVTHLLQNSKDSTTIYLSTAFNPHVIVVKETPDEIQKLLKA